VWCRRGRISEAERLVREALELRQNYADLHKIMGDILLRKGETMGAREQYQQALAINPRFAGAAAGYVVAARKLGKGREADEFLDGFLQDNPDQPLLRALRASDKLGLEDR